MNEKRFFRESNIWRLIGLGVLLIAGAVAAIAPEAKGFGYDTSSASVAGIIAIFGGLLLAFPIFKEGYLTWKAPKSEPVQQDESQQ
jgi:type IV secretory pathway TrbF-like protein